MGPAYHPDWLVEFWLTTPILNWLNPHYLLILIGVGLTILYFTKKRTGKMQEAEDHDDQRFKHLLLRKNVIEEQMGALEGKLIAAEITEEEYAQKKKDYVQHLEHVKIELKKYTL